MNSYYDFSTVASNGEQVYDTRTITAKVFLMQSDMTRLHFLYTRVLEWLIGLGQSKLVFDFLPSYYFLAEVQDAPSWEELNETGELTITFVAEPYKYSTEPAENLLWDDLDFDLPDYIQDTKFNISESKTITLYSSSTKPVIPVNGLAYGNNPKMLVLHHAKASTCTIQDIHQWHLQNGWAGCGYHFLVRKDGTVYRGRPEDAIGAHCPGVNATSLGICAEGNFMTEAMTEVQKNAIVELCKYLCNKYGINEIKGHRELYSTDCPGTNYPLSQIRELIDQGGKITTSTSTVLGSGLLKLWCTGDAVKDLQQKLRKLGYNLIVDGIFGQNTFNAVEDFQAKHGLTVDGIVGPATTSALDAAITAKSIIDIGTYKYLQHEIGATEDNIPGPETLSKCPELSYGSNSNVVKWIQNHLGITSDGIIGQNTWRALLGL